MFTRVVDIRCKAGKTDEVAHIKREEVLPLLSRQPGFQGEIPLVSPAEPTLMRSLSFWKKREHAERFQREQFSLVAKMLRPLCQVEPVVSSFDLNGSPVQDIDKGKAA